MSIREDFAIRLIEERARLGLSQADFARQLDVSAETVRRYETGQREAGVEFLAKAAGLGLDVQYVLTGVKSENLKKAEKASQPLVHIESGGTANIIHNANNGSVINFNQRYVNTTKAEVKPNENHISQQQAAILTKLVNDIVELEAQTKQRPKTHRSVWAALNAHCGVTRYLLINYEDYDKAEKYLRMWIGRLNSQKSAPVADNEEWRKRKYAYIKINTKDKQDWMDAYLQRNFKTKSLSNLTDSELDKTYRAVASKRQKTKKSESGYVESIFLWITASCGLIAWFFAALANYISSFDYIKSMPFGSISIVFWLFAVIIAILGTLHKRLLIKGDL